MSEPRCVECEAPAEFQHHEGGVDIYTCAAHRCDGCKKAEAQVQAVRHQIAEERYSDPGDDAYCLGYNDACDDILAILDGGDA